MPRPRLAQHWLTDHRVCDKIADAVGLASDETCIEIGGGKGALTKQLAKSAKRLIVYEIDHNWAEHLRAYGPTWAHDPGTFEVREADALKIDWSREALDLDPGEPLVIAGNLPYYITSPLLLRIAYSGLDIRRALFLIQKEVAERIAAAPNDSPYGRLTVSLGAFLETEILFDVPPEAFKPPPKVNSSLIRMRPRATPILGREWAERFERVVQIAFHMRRKTLRNNLRAGFPEIPEDRIDNMLGELGLQANSRAQEIDVEHFVSLTRRLFVE